METSIDRTKWYDRILASFIYFTRLPFWRMHEPPKECFAAVMEHWPLTGWLTGGLMAATLYVGSMYLPYMVAVLLAIVVRLLVTGARQEDGVPARESDAQGDPGGQPPRFRQTVL